MDTTIKKICAGDIRTASRLIRDIEDKLPDAKAKIKKLYAHTGKSFIIGITGAPGAGKSTLTDALISEFRKLNKTVGVLAVDPTSPFTGGAILGDRIRMQRHAEDAGVFVRSLATRGALGGLSQAAGNSIHVMEAMGKDIIIVETVGIGQQEIDIINHAHTVLVVLVPGMGDEIQTMKAGLMEIADVFVINKADRAGARQLQTELSDIENKLAAARRFFNNAVSEYNAAIESFPATLFAARFGFTHREFFDVGETARQQLDAPPAVKF